MHLNDNHIYVLQDCLHGLCGKRCGTAVVSCNPGEPPKWLLTQVATVDSLPHHQDMRPADHPPMGPAHLTWTVKTSGSQAQKEWLQGMKMGLLPTIWRMSWNGKNNQLQVFSQKHWVPVLLYTMLQLNALSHHLILPWEEATSIGSRTSSYERDWLGTGLSLWSEPIIPTAVLKIVCVESSHLALCWLNNILLSPLGVKESG